MEKKYTTKNLEVWGGLECTINRVNDSCFDQLSLSGHYLREGDIRLIAELGIKTLRYPVLWEKHEPVYNQSIDWTFTDKKFAELNRHGITPIAGLLHHGSGPLYTSLLDENFPFLFASYAGKVARKFPWIQYYTPINEPLTTARFSGLYGLWYPHNSNDISFAKMILNQVKAIILAMQEIRKINPAAKLVQTEDLSKTYSTESLIYQAAFENERRWLTYDLLCGRVQPGHTMWNYFLRLGIREDALTFFINNAMPPDIMGFNYYVTSERYLDENFQKYPPSAHGGNELHKYADVEAIRVDHKNPSGLAVLLKEAWDRYKFPIVITEAHINSGREDQLRWLHEIFKICSDALYSGINIKAISFWSLFGSYGWNNLLTNEAMDYESGAFDLRAVKPRATAVAGFIKSINQGKTPEHTLFNQKGWWHQPNRFYTAQKTAKPAAPGITRSRPLIIVGKTGTLGRAFSKICDNRNLSCILAGRHDLDITNEKIIDAFLDAFNPWAVINTAGFVNIDQAEDSIDECFNVNTIGPVLLADACKKRNISFLTFSSDQVFDGHKKGSYYETDSVNPLNVYGSSKATAEKKILGKNPAALIIRTAAFFGPWDTSNFVVKVLNSVSAGQPFYAAHDVFVTPTYVPQLVIASLDLLIDGECGIWHITNATKITWRDFAKKIAIKGGFDPELIIGRSINGLSLRAERPKYSVLESERGTFLGSIDQALDCYFNECGTLPTSMLKREVIETLSMIQ